MIDVTISEHTNNLFDFINRQLPDNWYETKLSLLRRADLRKFSKSRTYFNPDYKKRILGFNYYEEIKVDVDFIDAFVPAENRKTFFFTIRFSLDRKSLSSGLINPFIGYNAMEPLVKLNLSKHLSLLIEKLLRS